MLEDQVARERSRAEGAIRSSAVNNGNTDAVHLLKDRIRDLEAELEQMNRENTRLFETVKMQSMAPTARVTE